MLLGYEYYFSSTEGLPSFAERLWSTEPPGRISIRLDPTSTFKVYAVGEVRKATFKFWDLMDSPEADNFPPWYVNITYIQQDFNFSKKQFNAAQLLALDTSSLFGYEFEGIIDRGCPFCGKDKVLNPEPRVDDRTIISWRFAFSDTGRLIVHVDGYEELLEHGLTGFSAFPVWSMYPDYYIVRLWMKKEEYHRRILLEFGGRLPEEIIHLEWGDTLFYFVPPNIYEREEFKNFENYLIKLDKADELLYIPNPPARKVGDLPKCRWVWLDITGNAGTEIDKNEYVKEAQCPKCGQGGWLPDGQLKLDYSEWDGSDFCKTETGRICVSKKAFKFLHKKWNEDAEPILNVGSTDPKVRHIWK